MPLANPPLPNLPLLRACYMLSLPLPEPKEMSSRNHFRTRTAPAFALLLLATGLLSSAARASDQGSLDTQKLHAVTVVTQNGNQTFATEFANTPDQRARGLM